MTTPTKEKRALKDTREFLYSPLDPKKTPRIPSATRNEARRLLRHYPWSGRVDEWGAKH